MSAGAEDRIAEDLRASGLDIADISARPLDGPTKAATNTAFSIDGYVIPYFTIHGGHVPFYRVKLFDSIPKYKQPKETPNHIYFPKGFFEVAEKHNYVVITEGEKKAAAACKLGIPTCALGGVDSWRNRLFIMPAEADLSKDEKTLKAKVPSGTEYTEDFGSPLARGMQELLDYLTFTDRHLIICYDADSKMSANQSVQKAAANLGYELRFRGVAYNKIRQIRLTAPQDVDKFGLDDYLMVHGAGGFEGLVTACLAKRSAFPRHPNVRDYLNKRLQQAKMSRKEHQQVSMAILSELDSGGMRLRSKQESQTYYFDQRTHKLLKAVFHDNNGGLTDAPFGQFLYRTFGVGSADQRLMEWLGTQFTGEDPVEDVSPYRVFARPDHLKDGVIYQLSDGAYVEVTANEIAFRDNGSNAVLFESEQVLPLDMEKLKGEIVRQYKETDPYECWWADVLGQVRLTDKTQMRMATALLYYIAPWLNRWRGTQLPIEMTLGEAGSGKSTLQELRLEIITGIPTLRNAPQDWKDWAASVTSTGGLHVIDNLQLGDKNLRQRLSDDVCRIITEPNPTIEMRKYYTNADLMRLPVRCQFGITAIKQPFLNADVLARAFIVELDKSQDLIAGNLAYDAQWKATQLQRYGGREAWIAHHLLVLQRFFRLVRTDWNFRYQAKYRLINVEQAMTLIGRVFGLKVDWIPQYLNGSFNKSVQEADWAFEGIQAWAATMRQDGRSGPKYGYHANDIAEWAASIPEYERCEELTNPRRCGRYLQTHKSMVASVCGLIEGGKANNRLRYVLVDNTTK